jgi:hypothetical protein
MPMTSPDTAEICSASCLCGTVRYRLQGPFGPMVHCHCSMCRKAHGSAFATFVGAPAAGFQWIAGQDNVSSYASSSQGQRQFCRSCGSVTPPPIPAGDPLFVPAGNLLQDCGARPQAHMFTNSRAPWITLSDELTKFPAAPPGYELPPLDQTPKQAATSGALAGSCLCGAIRYELSGAPLVMVNCHCSRCRRGRSAAHATNLFVQPQQLRWLAGESLVRVFDLPGAERFGVNFCPTCGGSVPRLSAKIGRVNVPAGSLDGDPGIGPAYHIFVGSKAAWFEIADDLPQHSDRAPAG